MQFIVPAKRSRHAPTFVSKETTTGRIVVGCMAECRAFAHMPACPNHNPALCSHGGCKRKSHR